MVRIVDPYCVERSTPERWGVSAFGITEAVAAIVTAVTASVSAASAAVGGAIAAGAGAIGIGAETAGIIGGIGGDLLVGGGIGGALGAGEAAITGGDVLKGFESGAITAGVLNAGAPLLAEAGLGPAASGLLAAGAGGALGAEATGANPIKGALSAAGTQGALSAIGAALPGGASPGAPGGGTPGAATPAPSGVATTGGDVSALPGNVLDVNTSLPAGAGGISSPSLAPAASLPSGTSATPDVLSSTGTSAPVGSNVSTNVPGQLGTGAAAGGAPSNVTGGLSLETNIPTQTIADVNPTFPTISGAPTVADDFLSRNKDWLVPGALTGAEALMGQQKPPFYNQLATEAKTLGTSGTEMMSYLKEGRLPPGLQANVDTAANAAKASIRSMYASRGMSGSSAEAQDLANVDQVAVSQGANIALQLFQSGLNETQLSEQLYSQLMSVAVSQDQELGNAIGNFASSVALAGRPVSVLGAGTGVG